MALPKGPGNSAPAPRGRRKLPAAKHWRTGRRRPGRHRGSLLPGRASDRPRPWPRTPGPFRPGGPPSRARSIPCTASAPSTARGGPRRAGHRQMRMHGRDLRRKRWTSGETTASTGQLTKGFAPGRISSAETGDRPIAERCMRGRWPGAADSACVSDGHDHGCPSGRTMLPLGRSCRGGWDSAVASATEREGLNAERPSRRRGHPRRQRAGALPGVR